MYNIVDNHITFIIELVEEDEYNVLYVNYYFSKFPAVCCKALLVEVESEYPRRSTSPSIALRAGGGFGGGWRAGQDRDGAVYRAATAH